MNKILLLLPVDVGQQVPLSRDGAGDEEAVAAVLGSEGQVVRVFRDRHELGKATSVRADDRVGTRLQESRKDMSYGFFN